MRASFSCYTFKDGSPAVGEPTVSGVELHNKCGNMNFAKLRREMQKIIDRVDGSANHRVERIEIQIQSGPRVREFVKE